jgi:hypothetical protein
MRRRTANHYSRQSFIMHITVCSAVRIGLTGLAMVTVLARGAGAQATSQQQSRSSPVGTWRGTSLCLVRPSACHDEVVVYRIARTKVRDSLTVDARKIVRGEEQEMGVLNCRFTFSDRLLTCPIPRGIWRFRVHSDSLVGELRLPDNTKFRDVRTVRAASTVR